MFYEIKLQVEKPMEDGSTKEVKEHYIFNCELFAEAEQKAMEIYNNTCDVFSIYRSSIIEIVNEKQEDAPFFKAKIVKEILDENSGKTKENKYYLLVCAKDVKEATNLVEKHIQQGLDDMRLDAVSKTRIIDLL